MVRFALFCALIIFLASCSFSPIPRYIKKEFNYSPVTHKASQRIFYDGMYKELHVHDSIPQKPCSKYYYTFEKDTSLKREIGAFDIIFFRNGMCTMGSLDELREDNFSKENAVSNPERFVRGGSYWGFYEINDDTLYVKAIHRNSLMTGSTDSFEEWFKIIDSQTLLPIYFRSISKSNCTEIWGSRVIIRNAQYPATKFYRIQENIVDPNSSWLINKKWFWKNAEEYQKWKSEVRVSKKINQ
jgi:hypothetical protein